MIAIIGLTAIPVHVVQADGIIRYVKENGLSSGTCDGSWDNACTLPQALAVVQTGDRIWVAGGTYTPTTSETDPRLATFQLKNNVEIYGGFAGTETDLSQRDLSAGNTSTLSGEIGNPSLLTDNTYHVVTGSITNNLTNSTAVLDGFTIVKGYATNIGGGMYVYGGSPTLRNLVFDHNTAASGGGLALSGSESLVSQVRFTNNTATSSGGGMYAYASTATISDVTFTENSATFYGGGMYISNGSSQPPFTGPTLTRGSFNKNQVNYTSTSAGGYGGGMYLASTSPTLNDLTFTQNSATSTNTTSGSGGQGGGIYATSSSPVLNRVVFDRNIANGARVGGSGGGMYSYSGNPTLTDCAFTGNVATGNNNGYTYGGGGGGLYVYFGTLTLSGGSFTGNISQNYYGGGLALIVTSQASVSNVTFDSNQAVSGYGKGTGGGAVYINSTAASFTDVAFTNNTAPIPGWKPLSGMPGSWGGAVLIFRASPSFARVNFSENSAVMGGGMYNSYSSNPTLTDVTFSANHAMDSGAGMLNYIDSSPTLRNVTFKNNIAGTNNIEGSAQCLADPNNCGGNSGGGGMYNAGGTGDDYTPSNPVLENVTFIGNQGGYGGAIYNDNRANPVLRNVTIAGNTALGVDILDVDGNPTGSRAAGLGAAIYNVMESHPQIVNSIVWGNSLEGSTRPDQIDSAAIDYFGGADSSAAQVIYSIMQGGFTGDGNSSQDPLLGALGMYGGQTEVLPLLPGSAAIDAGRDDSGICTSADQRGIPRPKGARCDLGAFESQGFVLTKTNGDGQQVEVHADFPKPIEVMVTSSHGEPVNGGLVTFVSSTSGASAALVGSPATISAGLASVTAQANSICGAYLIQASASGADAVSFAMTNDSGLLALFLPLLIR
ncbi:MAG TPA: choice-of-anchor Q domain-containing protein [Anaerolineaceae bacterium]|nr:choice-of-anchor Q domain-containing protein [Anaerolineaceae bacterium]